MILCLEPRAILLEFICEDCRFRQSVAQVTGIEAGIEACQAAGSGINLTNDHHLFYEYQVPLPLLASGVVLPRGNARMFRIDGSINDCCRNQTR